MTAMRRSRSELRGSHVLAMLVVFFGITIAVNVYMAVAAVRTFPGEDVMHPYVQGLEYNQTLAERRAQAARGWRAIVSLQPTNSGSVLLVELRDRADTALDRLTLAGVLRWPTDAQRDRALVFHEVSPGLYSAPLSALTEGNWQLRARAVRGADAFDFEADITWPTVS